MSSGRDHSEVDFVTKAQPPPPGAATIRRERLLDRLALVAGRTLTLVVAPAGWGKSTLACHLVGAADVPLVWLSLDRGDNDPRRFWRCLLSTASSAIPDVATAALRYLELGDPQVPREVVSSFANSLADVGKPLVLVLDDYHVIFHPDIHATLRSLIDRAPATLFVVVLSRTRPPWPLPRWHVHEKVVVVQARDLAFTPVEAAELLAALLGEEPADGVLELLMSKTDGWPAALKLAAFGVRETCDAEELVRGLSGGHREIFGFLAQEVILGLAPPLRTFLLETSMLSRLSADVCTAVTDDEASRDLLADAIDHGLFISPLDRAGTWWSYHFLFADVLRRELRRLMPGRERELLVRASRWHFARGEFIDAANYAISSGEPDLITEVVATAWAPTYSDGDQVTVVRWLDALPDHARRVNTRIGAARTLSMLDSGDFAGAETVLRELSGGAVSTDRPAGLVSLFTGFLRFKEGSLDDAREILSLTDPAGMEPRMLSISLHTTLTSVVRFWLGEGTSAELLLSEAQRLAVEVGSAQGLAYVAGHRLWAAAERGDEAACRDVLADPDVAVLPGGSRADDFDVTGTHFAFGILLSARARLALHDGSAEEAWQLARDASQVVHLGAGRPDLAGVLLTAALAAKAVGEKEESDRLAAEAEAVLDACSEPGPILTAWRGRLHPDRPTRTRLLTERELAVVELLDSSMTQRQIAAALYVSVNTLKSHLLSVYRKLGVTSRVAAVRCAREMDLLG
ncbi:LuxR C-terminal-related transcriptional regulator [Lentzea sp. NPDC102401]|uniref:LuxR C-terminal-related transcriptional regulator n=1 Tax=Lentzea sp. NPDC102401 TaxID=3364128 RepID=UPI00382B8C01